MTIKDSVVKILKEYVILEKMKDDFEVLPTSKEEAEPFVMKHYLEKFPTGIKRIYGIYQKSPNTVMIGVIIYGVPFMTAAKFLEPEVKLNETLELKRLFINDIGVKNLESFVIGQSLKLLKRDEPQIKVVITFADDKRGHKGTIYQATNAIYLGSGGGKHKYIYIIGGDVNSIKNRVQKLVQSYPKKDIDDIREERELSYIDVGHNYDENKGIYSKIWWWNNDEEELHVKPGNNIHMYQSGTENSNFRGRYDPVKNVVSIAGDISDLPIPQSLIQRLKFEFGYDIKFKEFFDESKRD